MPEFISKNIIIILTLFGAIFSFLISFIGILFKKKPVLVLAILAIMGFTVGITYQIYDYHQKQETARKKEAQKAIDAAAQKARDNVIDEINVNVLKVKNTVDFMANKMKGKTLNEVATELINIRTRSDIDFEEVEAYAKKAREMWPLFADWIASFDSSKMAPSLYLTLNSSHNYDSLLLLGYLLTSKNSHDSVDDFINDRIHWKDFPAEKIYINSYSNSVTHLHWILFYDGTNTKPAAFADAAVFTQELILYLRNNKYIHINTLLNHRGPGTITKLQEEFPSIKKAVFDGMNPAGLVKLMINNRLEIAVASEVRRNYVAKLVRMIQLAAKNG